MKQFRSILILILIAQFPFFSWAKSLDEPFATPRDMTLKSIGSNIFLKNNRNTPSTVYGLYVRQFGYVTPGDTCDHATAIYPGPGFTDNMTAGPYVSPLTINAGKSAEIGTNFLYNMIYQVSYYVYMTIVSSPPGCAMPGCTWGTDTTIYNWCIQIGALSPVTTSSGYTATVPPAVYLASDTGYDYNMINSYVTLGPISCNDQTMTCSVSDKQTQSIP